MDSYVLNVVRSYSFSHDDLLNVCENIFDILDKLKEKHTTLKSEFTALEKSSKNTLIKLNYVNENYKKLEAKKTNIEDKLYK